MSDRGETLRKQDSWSFSFIECAKPLCFSLIYGLCRFFFSAWETLAWHSGFILFDCGKKVDPGFPCSVSALLYMESFSPHFIVSRLMKSWSV